MKVFLSLILLTINCSVFGITVTSDITTISSFGTHTTPQLASSRNGSAVAIWTENFPDRIEAAYFDGSFWQAPIIIAPGSFPQVAIDANGNAIAVWLNTSNRAIFASRFDGGWSVPVLLSALNTGNAAPQIAVTGSGNALAVWIQTNPQTIVGASFNASTGVWSAPTALITGSVSFPLVSLDDNDRGIVMWTGPSFEIEAVTVSIP